MKYGYISYGSLLYHSSAAIETEYVGVEGYPGQPVGGNFHTVMNMPANVSTWDAVGHSENLRTSRRSSPLIRRGATNRNPWSPSKNVLGSWGD